MKNTIDPSEEYRQEKGQCQQQKMYVSTHLLLFKAIDYVNTMRLDKLKKSAFIFLLDSTDNVRCMPSIGYYISQAIGKVPTKFVWKTDKENPLNYLQGSGYYLKCNTDYTETDVKT